ncbi:MAG: hypothetical protein H7A45_02850 [Verrucomicrobiales bacterium]|nr:hypothetical protein [Verrucomicrobiales bacterium]MCP5528595.1 hypothetical protein [Verrucomicrobiales bacterium]
MPAFLVRLTLFLLLQALLGAAVLHWGRVPTTTNYLAGTREKHARLQRIAPPRVLLVGGSNVPFGFQSARIEDALGLAVVNLGLVGGLGIGFMLDEVRDAVAPGDVVVLSFEYELFNGGSDAAVQRQVVQFRPANLRHLPVARWPGFLDRDALPLIGGAFRAALGLDRGGDASATDGGAHAGFNAWGDYVGHWGRPRPAGDGPRGSRGTAVTLTGRVREQLARFAQYCRERGARCALTFPPHPTAVLEARRDEVTRVVEALRAIPGLAVLDGPFDQAYPEALFYDTGYHLVEAGSAQRTDKLIAALRPLIAGR